MYTYKYIFEHHRVSRYISRLSLKSINELVDEQVLVFCWVLAWVISSQVVFLQPFFKGWCVATFHGVESIFFYFLFFFVNTVCLITMWSQCKQQLTQLLAPKFKLLVLKATLCALRSNIAEICLHQPSLTI